MRATPRPAHRALPWSAVLLLSLLFCIHPARAVDLKGLFATAGEGAVQTEARDVGRFDSLKLGTGARVIVRQGERPAVDVRAEANVLPMIETYVEDGTLVVEDARRFTSSAAEVVVTVRRLTALATTNKVAVVVEGLHRPSLTLAMGGSSAVDLRQVAIGKLDVAMGGSSALSASGSVDKLSCQLAGSSAVQASQLAAKDVSVAGGGSAQAVVWASDSLSLRLGGSAGVSHYGAARPNLAIGGSATVMYLGPAPAKQP